MGGIIGAWPCIQLGGERAAGIQCYFMIGYTGESLMENVRAQEQFLG